MFLFQGFLSQILSAFISQCLDFLNLSFSFIGEQMKEKTPHQTTTTATKQQRESVQDSLA